MSISRWLKFSIGLVCAGLFSWLLLQQLNVNELTQVFKQINSDYLFAALLAFLLGYACRIARWQAMLSHNNPDITWLDCAGPLMASFAANNVLPFRAGDVMRGFYFSNQLGVNPSAVLATLLVERLLDLLMVLVLLTIALLNFNLDLDRFAGVSGIAILLACLGILSVLLFPGFWLGFLRSKANPVINFISKFSATLFTGIQGTLETLTGLARIKLMLRLIIWSVAVWVAEGGVYFFAALGISGLTLPSASWVALPLGTLATLIPSTPGYIGTFDYAIMRGMTALHNSAIHATAYALTVHMLLWLPATFLGGFYLVLQPIRKLFSKHILL